MHNKLFRAFYSATRARFHFQCFRDPYRRAYRLGQNRKVETLDLCSAAGAMAMILPGVFMRHAPGATGLFPLGYAAQGMSVGVLAFVAAQATGIGIVDMLTKDKDEK